MNGGLQQRVRILNASMADLRTGAWAAQQRQQSSTDRPDFGRERNAA